MKPRLTHLLLGAAAFAIVAGAVVALRLLHPAAAPGGVASAVRPGTAVVGAPHPAGGAIVTGLRRAFSPTPRTQPAPPPASAAAPPPSFVAAPLPATEPAAATPAAESAVEGRDGPPEGLEGVVSTLPAIPPTPPPRPADLARSLAPPLPPTRPADLVATAAVEAPPVEPAPTTPPDAAPQEQPAPTAAATPAPVYADAPLPPVRPRDLALLTPAAAVQATGEPAPAVAPQAGEQVARLPEPTLRPAPEDAFQQPPPKFGMGDPVFVRIFKQEGQLELWLKKNGRYALYKTFPICKWSGRLGPKIKEADYQSPEGFYSVSARQLNPHSNYHRAFNVGYPNAFDRQNGRTGGLVMVHGACKSVGCFAMTDRGIEEIYGFVEAALRAGQKEVPVHIFPFRMTEANLSKETGGGGGWLSFVSGGGSYAQWAAFWKNLKQGYDLFEHTGEPPVAFACGDHYEFGGGSATCRRVAGW
jgi:hypothetical protein